MSINRRWGPWGIYKRMWTYHRWGPWGIQNNEMHIKDQFIEIIIPIKLSLYVGFEKRSDHKI